MRAATLGAVTAGLGFAAAAVGLFVFTNNSKVSATNGSGTQQVFSNVTGSVVANVNDDYDTQRRREAEAAKAQMINTCQKLLDYVENPKPSSDFNTPMGYLHSPVAEEVKFRTYFGDAAFEQINAKVGYLHEPLGAYGMELVSASMGSGMRPSVPASVPKEELDRIFGEMEKTALAKASVQAEALQPQVKDLCSDYLALQVVDK